MKKRGLARDCEGWTIADESGDLTTTLKTTDALLEHLRENGRAVYLSRDSEALRELTVHLSQGERQPAIAARGRSGGGGIELCGVHRPGESWRVSTPWAMWGKGAEGKAPVDDSQHPAAYVGELARAWSEAVEGLGLKGSKLSAGTAAAELLPVSWLRASARFSKTEHWKQIRQSYYGGRVELFKPGWQGEAVEHDLQSAYGAALAGLLGYMPDFQLYPDKRPLRAQPAWMDATVEVSGPVAPLPKRDLEKPWRIDWPTSGRWRGWYTRADLETPGVHVVEVHQCHSGRYRNDLRRPVAELLEKRQGADAWTRAIVRQLVVSLAGKLAQKPVEWRVWEPVPGLRSKPPRNTTALGSPGGACVMVYPVEPDRYPPTVLPQTASYVTARTRAALYTALVDARGEAIYCDTDAIHLPADHPAPKGSGPNPGQWAAKVRGEAHYAARRNYRLGDKLVNWVDQ